MSISVNASSLKRFNSLDREQYFKVSLSASEISVYHQKEKRVSSFFKENDCLFNVSEFYRIFLLNFDNPDLQSVMLEIYKKDAQSHFLPAIVNKD